ncbi:MAG: hypothetical protein QOJ38_1466 [Solirubrobacterales bacterium]|jgi:hypothetical protein|nr:hypothetical protein [Solirubrobacterales bacterium]
MEAEELAQQAADAVRAVIGEAERRAAEIVREAEAEAARIRGGGDPAGEVPTAPPAQAAPESPVEAPAPSEPQPSTEAQGARLIALKMAMDGASRDEVAKHLSDELGIDDGDELLDDIFARVAR